MNSKELAVEIFRDAQRILCDESKWARNYESENVFGRFVMADGRDAVKWSYIGACYRAAGLLLNQHHSNDIQAAWLIVFDTLADLVKAQRPNLATSVSMMIHSDFNNHPSTTFHDVQLLLWNAMTQVSNATMFMQFDYQTQAI